jgi:hypothetical protein
VELGQEPVERVSGFNLQGQQDLAVEGGDPSTSLRAGS